MLTISDRQVNSLNYMKMWGGEGKGRDTLQQDYEGQLMTMKVLLIRGDKFGVSKQTPW